MGGWTIDWGGPTPFWEVVMIKVISKIDNQFPSTTNIERVSVCESKL